MQTEENLSFKEKVAGFLQKKQKVFFICVITAAVVLIGFIVGVNIGNVLTNKAFTTLDTYNTRYEALRFDITDPEKEAEVSALIDDINGFAKSHSDYAGARAYNIVANIHADLKNWALAESSWIASAKAAGAKSYFTPLALYNAAVAAEEQGNTERAIDLYKQSLLYSSSFPAAARATFALGRLNEAISNTQEAIQAYQNLIENYANESVWVNLAHNRIIALGR